MAPATASGESPPLQIELPLTYSLQKLDVELKKAGFQLECSQLDLPTGALEPGPQVPGGGSLADIASDAAAAARHASAALAALLASNPAHSACAMLASAAQAAAAAALALVEGEDFDPELDDVCGEGGEAEDACCTACHELGDGTRCTDTGCPDTVPLALQLAASWGTLRCTTGGAELLCTWVQEHGSDVITLTRGVTDDTEGPALWLRCTAGSRAEDVKHAMQHVFLHAHVHPGKGSKSVAVGEAHAHAAEEHAHSKQSVAEQRTAEEHAHGPNVSAPDDVGCGQDPVALDSTPARHTQPAAVGPLRLRSSVESKPAWRDIRGGAPELQAVLDSLPEHTPVLLSWSADWVPGCAEIEAALQAALPPGAAALLRLGIEDTATNRALALKRVACLPQSRKPGSKLVLKSGSAFPALTVLSAPEMQGETFEGPTAAKAAVYAARELGEAQLAALVETASVTDAPAAGKVVDGRELSATTDARELFEAARNLAPGMPTLLVWDDQGQVPVERVAQAVQGAVTVVTLDACNPAAAELQSACGCVENPATALVVGDCVVGRAVGPAAKSVWGLLARCAQALQHAQERSGAGDEHDAGSEGDAGCEHDAGSEGSADTTDQILVPSGVEEGGVGLLGYGGIDEPGTTSASANDSVVRPNPAVSVFDPPDPKLAKPGYTKRMPNGDTVHYFPKMPCLKCGCPWWSSDEWDAKCIRCGWDCESTGYDDDSQPLPKYKKKWEGFVAQINAGKTPAWPQRAHA